MGCFKTPLPHSLIFSAEHLAGSITTQLGARASAQSLPRCSIQNNVFDIILFAESAFLRFVTVLVDYVPPRLDSLYLWLSIHPWPVEITAYFTELAEDLQDEIIARTSYGT